MKRSTRAISVAAVLSAVSLSLNSGHAANLAGWDVSSLVGGVNTFGPQGLTPTDSDPNLTIGGLTRGSGVGTTGTGANRAWGANTWGQSTEADAITAGQFATFSLTANSGYSLSLSSISQFSYRRSSTGPSTGYLQYEVDGGPFVDITTLNYSSSASTGGTLSPIDLSGISALQNVAAGTSVTFRIVNTGATTTAGTWYVFDTAVSSADDLVIQGSVASAPVPEPSTLAMASAGGILVLLGRLRRKF
jgi:hypothetical protein